MINMDISLLKTGDALLSHSKGRFKFVAKAIRSLTKSYWNHVSYVINCEDEIYVLEAQPKGLIRTPISHYLNSKYDLKIVRLKLDSFKDKQEYNNAIKLATNRILSIKGKKYDFNGIVFLSLKYIFKGLFSNRTNKFQKREKFFCSESYCYAYNGSSSKVRNLFAGIKHPEAKCGQITPKDIGKSVNTEFICGVDKD